MKQANEDVYLALLALNGTPSQDGTSPPYKLFNRQTCTTFPSANVHIKTCNTQKRKTISCQKYLMVPLFVSIQITISHGKKWEKLSTNIQTLDPTTYFCDLDFKTS